MRKIGWLDLFIYVFIGAIGMFVMYNIKNWMDTREMELFSTTSPLIFPFLIGIALLVFIVLTVLSDLRGVKNTEGEDEDEGKDVAHDVGMAAVYAFGVIIYTFVIRRVSFLVGTIVFLIIAMAIMNYEQIKIEKRIGNAVLVSVIAVPILYFVFHNIFNVMLP